MANKLKKNIPETQSENIDKFKTPKKNTNLSKGLEYIFSGEFLFSRNFRRSPFWLVLYIVLLILIYIGMRYEPVKRYYAMRKLNNELVEKYYRNSDIKAQLQYYQSPSNLINILSKEGFEKNIEQPFVIKVINNERN